jgi:integrase
LPSSTIRDFFESWLKRKELEAGDKTHLRYQVAVRQFVDYLGTKANKDITHLTNKEIAGFRASLANRLSVGTVNISLKIIRAALNQAKRDGLVDQNEAERVSLLERVPSMKRRPFSLPELKKILEVANDEWRGMITFGLYTGLRPGDIANLTWSNVDLRKAELSLVTSKTRRNQNLLLAKPLLDYLEAMPSSDDPQQPVLPRAFECSAKSHFNGTLSKQFHQLLVSAGLAQRRINKETGKCGSVKPTQNELSFHCLRHTATNRREAAPTRANGGLTAALQVAYSPRREWRMSSVNNEALFEGGAPKRLSGPPTHLLHRHKKFRVRPEAMGIGYETSSVFPWKSSARLARSPAAEPTSDSADVLGAGTPSHDAVSSDEAQPLSEKEIVRATALRGIRICLAVLVCLTALTFVHARFGSVKEFGIWVLSGLPQPVLYERPAQRGSSGN